MSSFKEGLFSGTLASILAGIILAIGGQSVPFIREHFIVIIIACLILGVFIFLLIKLFKNIRMRSVLGVTGYYKTRDMAIKKNDISLKKSHKIDTLNFKGYELIEGRNTYKSLAYQLASNPEIQPKLRCLLLNPDGSADKYIENRIKELGSQTNPDLNYHKEKIEETVKGLELINNKFKNISCQYFCEELKWSLIIADSFLLISFYERKKSQAAPCFKIDKESLLGDALVNHFEDLWESNATNDAFAKLQTKVQP